MKPAKWRRLRHPGILTIHAVEEQADGSFFLVTEYFEGGSLADWIDAGKSFTPRDAARLVACVAEAAHYAHEHGIVHRDLKPANILLDGTGLPHVADLGLAIADSEGRGVPNGEVCGTPRYMAPEQVRGAIDRIDRRSDVWSLGVVLYELLSRRAPFPGPTQEEYFQQILHVGPVPLQIASHGISRDLEAVVLKCLEKDADRRYQSAVELAVELRRYLSGLPVQPRPTGVLERGRQWVRRRPSTAALIAFVVLAVAVAVVGLTQHRATILQSASAVTLAERTMLTHRMITRKFDYARTIRAAYQAWQNDDVTATLDLLQRSLPKPGEEDLRSFEWYYLRRLCEGGLWTLRGHDGRVYCAAFSPDDSRLASCSEDGTVRIWEVATGKATDKFIASKNDIYAIAWSPDGRLLATGGEDGQIRLWDANSFELRAVRSGHTGGVVFLVFDPDGRIVASAGKDSTVRLWDVVTGNEHARVTEHRSTVHCLAFSPDGTQLFSASEDGVVQVTSIQSEDDPSVFWESDGRVFALALSPDGHWLAVSCETGYCLFDLAKNSMTGLPVSHRNTIRSLAFSPDGKTIATTGDDQTIRIWDVESQAVRHVYRGHIERVYHLTCNSDGLLASAGKDGTIHLWNMAVPQERFPLLSEADQFIGDVEFSPDGERIAAVLCGYDQESRMKCGTRRHASRLIC